MEDSAPKTAVYILHNWDTAEDGKFFKWVQTLTTTGVGDVERNCLPICNFDCDNVTWSGKSVLTSINLDLWETIGAKLGNNATRTEVFCSIAYNWQQLALQKMRLTEGPRQYIETFVSKIAEMSHWISGTGSAPIYLSTLVATAFIDCEVLDFQMKATGLHDMVDSNLKALSIYDIIRTLKTKLWSLKDQGMWSPSKGNKLDIEGELAGLKLAMNKLGESHKRDQTGVHTQYKDGKVCDLSGITCFPCHKKGHFQDKCLLSKKSSAISIN